MCVCITAVFYFFVLSYVSSQSLICAAHLCANKVHTGTLVKMFLYSTFSSSESNVDTFPSVGVQLSGRAIDCRSIGPWFNSVCPLSKIIFFVFIFCQSFAKGRRIENLTKSLCFYLMILHIYLQTEVQYRVWCPDPFDSRRQCYRRQTYVVSMKRNHHQMAWKSGTLTIE